MFNRPPRQGFAWRLHLLRDIAATPAHGPASILSSRAPCEGWARFSNCPEAHLRPEPEGAFLQAEPRKRPLARVQTLEFTALDTVSG
jgi:hypothetical protein